jgi:hypothetical protein
MKSINELIGFVVGQGQSTNPPVAIFIKKIAAAEENGIRQIRMNQALMN